MWSPDRLFRAAVLGCVLGALPLVAACTMAPVYATGTDQIALSIAEPANRLEQIAYRTLRQRLDFAVAADAPRLTLAVTVGDADFGLSSVGRPVSETRTTATIVFTVTDASGAILAQGTRTAATTYVDSPQAIASDTAQQAAQERAVASATEAVRLALLAQFPAL